LIQLQNVDIKPYNLLPSLNSQQGRKSHWGITRLAMTHHSLWIAVLWQTR